MGIGLVVEGPFEGGQEVAVDNGQEININDDSQYLLQSGMNWIAAEEECTSTQMVQVQNENELQPESLQEDDNILKPRKRILVKVYKSKGSKNKTLQNLKMKLAETRRKLKEKSRKIAQPNNISRKTEIAEAKYGNRKVRRKKQDLSYRATVSLKKMIVKSKYFYHMTFDQM